MMPDKIGPAPETRSLRFLLLLFGASAAPIFWLGQLILGYAVTAHVCFPGRAPAPAAGTSLFNAMIVFDLVAAIAALAGGAVSFWCWRASRQSRDHFLALWGIFSSLCFLIAILFNAIGSLTVPPCLI